MTSRYRLQLPSPAKGFMDSFLIGNGRLGASLRSGIGTERLDLNVDTLWSGGPQTPDPRPSPVDKLPQLRAAIRARDFDLANTLSRQMQGRGWTASYQPIAGLLLDYAQPQEGVPPSYVRCLDMAEAVAETGYEAIALRAFVSAPDNVVVLTAVGTGLLPREAMRLSFDCPHPSDIQHWQEGEIRWISVAGRAPAVVIPPYVEDVHPVVDYGTDTPDAAGTVASGTGFAAVAALQALPDGSIRLIAAAESGFRGFDQRPSADLAALLAIAKARVAAALAKDTATIVAAHRADYRHYFDRVDLDLTGSHPRGDVDPAQAELLYHYGRYLLISGSRPGGEPTNLQGIWNPYTRPAWSCNYTSNINVQMNYWPAEQAALGDLTEPLHRMIRELTQAGVENARRYYGAGGSVTHHNTDLWRFTYPVNGDPVWANWPSGLAWLAQHSWDHLDYGNSAADFDRTDVLPVLRAVTAFTLDLLVDYPDGTLVQSPSSSPESSFLTSSGKRAGVSEGAAMDQELAHEVLSRYLKLAARLGGEDEALVARARQALPRLRQPVIDADGVLLEWSDARPSAEPGHRHMSHLYGLHPAIRVTELTTPAMYEAARKALQLRLSHGGGHTGWSQAWVLCFAARLRDGALAEQAIEGLLKKLTTRALMVLHPYPGMPENSVFQIDGNYGAVAGLAELVVQSHEGAISLLKALPPSWTHGSARGQRCRGGHIADIAWTQGQFSEATVTAATATTLVLDLPADAGAIAVYGPDGRNMPLDRSAQAAEGRQRLAWAGQAGARYDIRRAG